MKEFNTTISSLNDRRLSSISWDIHSDPTIPGVLGYFNESSDIIPIPLNCELLGSIRPISKVKTINVPIAIHGCGYANNIPNETHMGYIKYRLNITADESITLLQFFKAIYDFYETSITEDQYIALLNEKKIMSRQKLFESFTTINTTKPKKALKEYFAGSMYFEGYDYQDKLMLYGT